MYHDTIRINFKNKFQTLPAKDEIQFDYSFLISKNLKDKFSPINYGELLHKFDEIGFDLKYIKFYDLTEDNIVFCSYNYQPNFDLFFSVYKKLLHKKMFNLSFEYGVIIDGIFKINNMNYFAGIHFYEEKYDAGKYIQTIIKGKYHQKRTIFYQIVNSDGDPIASEVTDIEKDFEQHFFEKHEVLVALRKYKLERLKLFDD